MANSGGDLSKVIRETQEKLGKHVKRPPLSEKNLSRPPFRFIHDIVTTLVSEGFLQGVFEANLLDSANVTTREAKTEFMKKLIAAIKDTTQEDVPVKISKILAGQEAEKTNLMLQCLAKAIEIEKPKGKSEDSVQAKPKSTPKPDAVAKDKKQPEKKAKVTTKTGGTRANQNAGSEKARSKAKESKVKEKPGKKNEAGDAGMLTKELPKTTKTENASVDSNKNENTTHEAISSASMRRQNSSTFKGAGEDFVQKPGLEKDSAVSDLRLELNSPAVNSNVDTLSLPHSPILPDSTAVKFAMNDKNDNIEKIEEQLDLSTPIENNDNLGKNGARPFSNMSKNPQFPDSAEALRTEGPRTSGNESRAITARPSSARPAPPRPKSTITDSMDENTYRPPTGKVSNVMLDTTELPEEDDTFIIREANLNKAPLLEDLDEAPELTLTGGQNNVEADINDLNPNSRGLLVNQILESKVELDEDSELKMDTKALTDLAKSKETSQIEIEKLKALLQDFARNANPLGKLLDYVREDVDTIEKETQKWKDEGKALDKELETINREAEATLLPLQQELNDVEAQIADKEDAIAATKMSILRRQERIEKILTGLDRVKSSHGKLNLPSASVIMDDSNVTSDSFQQGTFENDFSYTLTSMKKSASGMHPKTINMFKASSDDQLDPDNFDPWRS